MRQQNTVDARVSAEGVGTRVQGARGGELEPEFEERGVGARRLPGRPSSPPARRWPAAQLGGLRPPVQIWSVQLRPCGTLLGTQVGARWADRTWNPVVLPQSPFPRVALRPQPLDHRGTQAPWHPAFSVSCHSGKLGFRQVKRFSAGPAASTFGRRDMPGHLNAGPSPGSPVRGQEAWTRTSESGLFRKTDVQE